VTALAACWPFFDDPAFLSPESEFPTINPPDETDRDRLINLPGPVPVEIDDLIRTSELHPSVAIAGRFAVSLGPIRFADLPLNLRQGSCATERCFQYMQSQ
jgi:hypothetical protein